MVFVSVLVATNVEAASRPSLVRTTISCANQGKSSYDAVIAAMRRGDALGTQRLARRLAAEAGACETRVARMKATRRQICGRTVAARGLRGYRDGGRTIDAAISRGIADQVFAQEIFRADALVRGAEAELGVGLEVFKGMRGCAKGRALPRELSRATRQLLPSLAQQVATMLVRAQGVVEPEDELTFGLLAIHLDTGRPPPAGAAEARLQRLIAQNPNMQKWRIAGFRTFWSIHATTVDWTRYRFDAQRFLGSFQTYFQWKVNALQNQRNQFLSGIVGSEEAWRKAFGDWRAWEQRWYTREQAAIAEYDAWDRSFKAERVLVDAEALVRQRP